MESRQGERERIRGKVRRDMGEKDIGRGGRKYIQEVPGVYQLHNLVFIETRFHNYSKSSSKKKKNVY